MMHRDVFALTAFNTLSSRVVLKDDILAALLPKSFVAIQLHSGAIHAVSSHQRRVEAIDATVRIAAPTLQQTQLSSE